MTIVEMVVAVFILGVVMGGMSLIIVDSLNLSRQNANRIVAANLATGELERLRSLPFEDLSAMVANGDGTASETRNIDGRTFDVNRSMYWSATDAETGPCLGTIDAGDENVLRIEVEVAWSRTLGIRPVRTDGWVAPPLGLYELSGGSLAVFVADHQTPSLPVSDVSVVLYGPTDSTGVAQSRSALTDVDGCAVFDDLTPGSYRTAIARAAYIDIDQRVSPTLLPVDASDGVNQDGGVAVRSRSWMEFRYAPAGDVTIDAEGWAGGALPMTALDWYVGNTRGSFPRAQVGSSSTVYPGNYELWAGSCPDADPSGTDPSDDQVRYWPDGTRTSTVSVDANGTHTATVVIGSLDVSWVNEVEPDPLRTVSLTATHVGPGNCSEGTETLELGTTTMGVDVRFAVPFGEWRITATEAGLGQLGQQVTVIDPRDLTDVPEVIFDAPGIEPPPPICTVGPPAYVGHTAVQIQESEPRVRDVAVPVGTQVGDLLVLEAYVDQGAAFVVPDGWTQGASEQQQGGAGSTRMRVWTKFAEASDIGGSLALGRPNNLPGGVALLTAYRNVASSVPQVHAAYARVSVDADSFWADHYQATAPSTHTYALFILSAGFNRGAGSFLASGEFLEATPRPSVSMGAPGDPSGPPWASMMSLRHVAETAATIAQAEIGWPISDRGASYLLVFPAGCEVG